MMVDRLSFCPPTRHIVILLLAISLSGCRDKVGSISGKVTFKGQPIPVGTVTYFGQKNKVVVADLSEDGSYIVDQLPVGMAAITVETPNVQPFALKPGDPPPPPGVVSSAYFLPNIRIPDHYVNRETSGLRLDVQEGPQVLDLTLTEVVGAR